MTTFSFDIETLTDWYSSDNPLLNEAILSMRENSKTGATILIERKFENAPTEELIKLISLENLNKWILQTFPKRLYYTWVNHSRNGLDFVLIKSQETVSKFKVDFQSKFDPLRVVFVGTSQNGLNVYTGGENDVSNFSVEENLDNLPWATDFFVDRNSPQA